MANTYYSISPTTDTIISLKNALISKYGSGVVMHYQTVDELIFSCISLSNKVIRVSYAASRIRMYYGDAWTSGTTITNSVQWAGYYTGTCTYINLILGDYTLMISSYQGTTIYSTLFIIGKLSNNKYAVISFCGGGSAYYTIYLGKDTSDNMDLNPVCFSDSFASGSGKLFKQPLILQRSDGSVETNSDGTLSTFRDIYNCSHALSNNADFVGTNYLMSAAGLFMGIAGKKLSTSIIAEF